MLPITRKIAILLAAAVLVSTVVAVEVYAKPSGMGAGKERGHARWFAEPLLIGHGFALKGDEYHILDVNAIRMSNVSSSFMRSLLWGGKGPEDIAKEIQNAESGETIRAHLRFGDQVYALNVTSYDNQSLKGDILTLPPRGKDKTDFTQATVGQISLSISKYEGDLLSTGTLTINNTDYKVLMASSARLRER